MTNLPKTENYSVIIPFFNSSKTIDRALKSVESQSMSPLEIIIVDDCSTPPEKQYLQQIADSSPLVRVVWHSHNSGPASARNTGWEKANGTWIAFLDSDDSWHPQKIEKQISILDKLNVEPILIGTDTKILSSNAEPILVDFQGNILYQNISLWSLLFRNQFATSTVILKRELQVRFSPGRRFSEDYELWLTIASLNKAMIKVNLPLTFYYKPLFGDSGLSSHLFGMAYGELQTYFQLFQSKKISLTQLLASSSFSLLKSGRRFLAVSARKLFKFSS